MSVTSRTAAQVAVVPARRHAAAAASTVAALALLGDAVVAAAAPDQMGDHSQGAGRVSELLVAAAFLAGALALVLLAPAGRAHRALWLLAPAGLAVAGLTMLGVVLTGAEPPEWLFLVAIAPTAVGMVAAAVIGVRARIWSWPVAVGVAAFLAIMFFLPFNSVLMALVWGTVALAASGVRGLTGRRTA